MNRDPLNLYDQPESPESRDRQRQNDEDLRWLMSGPRGRRIAYRHLERCGIFQQSFAMDSHVTAFNEGRRSVGLMFLADLIRVCPEKHSTMMQESIDDNRSAGDRRRDD